MIIAGLLNLILALFKIIFFVLPDLGKVELFSSLLTFFNDSICDGLSLFCFFIRPSTVVFALGLVITIFTFHHTYGFIKWVVEKIPFLGIK